MKHAAENSPTASVTTVADFFIFSGLSSEAHCVRFEKDHFLRLLTDGGNIDLRITRFLGGEPAGLSK